MRYMDLRRIQGVFRGTYGRFRVISAGFRGDTGSFLVIPKSSRFEKEVSDLEDFQRYYKKIRGIFGDFKKCQGISGGI